MDDDGWWLGVPCQETSKSAKTLQHIKLSALISNCWGEKAQPVIPPIKIFRNL